MKRFEKILFRTILGGTSPLFLFLTVIIFWFYVDKNESTAVIYAVVAILIGFIIDLIFLKKWMSKLYELPLVFIIVIYGLYHIGIYGMFMGFPVFNVIMAPLVGYYAGKRMLNKDLPVTEQKAIIHKTAIFSASAMLLLCALTTYFVFKETTLGNEVQIILGLSFEISHPLVVILTLSGALALIVLHYFATKFVMMKVIKKGIVLN